MTLANSKKLLLVASTGGHLAELVRLHPMLDASDDSLWVTFRTPQSEALLAGRRVHYVRYIRPRDLVSVIIVFFGMLHLLLRERFDGAVSTGSGIALACFPAALVLRVPAHYIESLGRIRGPSTTGRLLAALPRTRVSMQSGNWGGRWTRHPSVLSTYRPVMRIQPARSPRLFVTLGTIEGYRFDALIDAVLDSGLADKHTVWQLGDSMRDDLPGRVVRQFSAHDFSKAVARADVVISHAGVGSLLVLLEHGRFPLLAIRRRSRGEHVDDHQAQLAEMVNPLGLGRVVEAEDITADAILDAFTRGVTDERDARAVVA